MPLHARSPACTGEPVPAVHLVESFPHVVVGASIRAIAAKAIACMAGAVIVEATPATPALAVSLLLVPVLLPAAAVAATAAWLLAVLVPSGSRPRPAGVATCRHMMAHDHVSL
jgi:hypothetical protein